LIGEAYAQVVRRAIGSSRLPLVLAR